MQNLRSYLKKLIFNKSKDFLHYLEELRGYSQTTITTYRTVLNEALDIIDYTQEEQTLCLNLMPYRIHIKDLNPKTISKKLSAIRSFVEYLNSEGMHVVLRSDESIKIAKTLPKPIAHKHILEALELAQLQEKLIVTLLYTLGLRISELQMLKLKDISDEWVRVVGKGSKQRDIPLIESSKKIIDEYLHEITPQNSKMVYLLEHNDEPLSQNALRYTITKVFKRVSLKVTPHQLRHSFATELLNSNAPIADVSELLGHASMATTQIYTKLGSALKLKNYNKAHPLGGIQ